MHSDSQSPHILVVDDALEILSLKREIFEEEGFRVTTLMTGTTNLNEILQLAPGLVISDYSDGVESGLLQQLTRDAPLGCIPLVLCSGAVREVETLRPQLDALGVGVVYKPFDIEHLLEVVREKLGLGSEPTGFLPPRSE